MPQLPGKFCDEQFSGVASLFPLPGLVVFPNAVQALHIFEPRYRQMLADSLRGDKLLAMATLADGWEGMYEGKPPVSSSVCLGQIASHSLLEDGCSNVLLMGLRRARIVSELPSDRLYRQANIEIVQDVYPDNCDSQRCTLQNDLVEEFKSVMPKSAMVADQLIQTMDSALSLGALTDLISYSLRLPTEAKLRLLADDDVDARARFLLEQIRQWDREDDADSPADVRRPRRGFPPDFSSN